MPDAYNGLLAGLPDETCRRLSPGLKPVTLEFGRTLYRPGQPLRYVYFPLDSLISKLYFLANGNTSGIGVIGREGIVGVSSFLSGNETTAEAIVIKTGQALRLGAHELAREFEGDPAFRQTLLNFTQAFMTQMGQVATCNRHHTTEQQLCRWLLTCLDRLSSNELRITQELIAHLLGVRREGITRAALKLRQNGLLGYSRGRITVLDVPRMEQLACECYRVVRNAYETLLPSAIPARRPTTKTSRSP